MVRAIARLGRIWRQSGVGVMITTVAWTQSGGVASFINSLRGRLGEGIRYCVVGDRGHKGGRSPHRRIVNDYLKFCILVTYGRPKLVHFNPSFRTKSLLRDIPMLLYAKIHGLKTVMFFHGWDADLFRPRWPGGAWFLGWALSRADAIVVLGSELERGLRSLGVRSKVIRLTTALDDETYRAFVECRNRQARRTRHAILFLARIEEGKGIFDALRAFAIVKARIPDATFRVVGDGSALPDARRLTLSLGLRNVEFSGYLGGERKSQAYCESDVYLLPTHTEGLPLTLLEAMGAGLAVVTSPVGGIPDIVADGISGFLVDFKDPQAIANVVIELLENDELRDRISKHNQHLVAERYLVSHVVHGLRRIYGEALGARHM